MSIENKIKLATEAYQQNGSVCGMGHPAYARGYNPRHYNYLPSSMNLTNK